MTFFSLWPVRERPPQKFTAAKKDGGLARPFSVQDGSTREIDRRRNRQTSIDRRNFELNRMQIRCEIAHDKRQRSFLVSSLITNFLLARDTSPLGLSKREPPLSLRERRRSRLEAVGDEWDCGHRMALRMARLERGFQLYMLNDPNCADDRKSGLHTRCARDVDCRLSCLVDRAETTARRLLFDERIGSAMVCRLSGYGLLHMIRTAVWDLASQMLYFTEATCGSPFSPLRWLPRLATLR